MSLLVDTKKLTEQLFRNGSTNNEQLQLLLWHLKEITELSNEQLAISEGSFPVFFMSYLTELANSYRPTNESQFPHKLLALYSSADEMRVNIAGVIDEFKMKMKVYEELDGDAKTLLLHSCFGEIQKISMNTSLTIKDEMDKCLQDIKY
jgi:hypothetical protein